MSLKMKMVKFESEFKLETENGKIYVELKV